MGVIDSPDGSVEVDINFIEADSFLVIGLNALSHRELRRELNRSMLAPANTLEGEHRKIAFYFIEAAAVPVS